MAMGSSTIAIARYSDRFEDQVIELISSIQREEFGLPITAEQQPDLRTIGGYYQQGAGDFWVALSEGRVVGTIALLDIGNRQLALRKMFVAAPYRGGEHGVAPSLLAVALASARKRDVAQIFLGTTEKFLAAHRFYEKNGFGPVPQAELPERFPRMGLDTRFYRLDLDTGAPADATQDDSRREDRAGGQVNTEAAGVRAVVLGLLTAVLVIFATEALTQLFFPPPPGIDFNDAASLRAAMETLPKGALVCVLVGWGLGALAGSWVAARQAKTAPVRHALILSAVLLAVAIFNMVMLPHPMWFQVVAVAVFPLAALVGARLARRVKPAQE